MRYFWPVIILFFILFSVHFAIQNSEIVVVKYSLAWLNIGVRTERPLFITLYLTLAFSVLYFLVYHTKLLARMRKLHSEKDQLKKQLDEEKEKSLKLQKQSHMLSSLEFTSDSDLDSVSFSGNKSAKS